MDRKKRIILQVALPAIIVLLMERYIGLPDHFNTVIYVILFSILTFFNDNETQSHFLNSNIKEKIIACGTIGVIAFFFLILLKYLLMTNEILQMILQVILSMICSVCIVIIICIVISKIIDKRR